TCCTGSGPVSSLLRMLLTDRNAGQAQAPQVEMERRQVRVVSCPTGVGVLAPVATPQQVTLACRVSAPLPHIAVHVVKAQPIRLVRAPLARAPQAFYVLEIGLTWQQDVRRLVEVKVEGTFGPVRHGTATAGIFPLHLRGDAIDPARFLDLVTQPMGEL